MVSAPAQAPGHGAVAGSSGLIAELVAPLFQGGPWSVLDLGPARAPTMAFFRQVRCRLGVADALAGLAALGREAPADAAVVDARLRELIPVDPERPWQVVLLWDALDYLPAPLLEALLQRLRPGLAVGAGLHGYVSTTARGVPEQPASYDILARDRVMQRAVPGPTQTPIRHTPWHLQKHLAGVRIERSRQHRDGRQEHLMRFEG